MCESYFKIIIIKVFILFNFNFLFKGHSFCSVQFSFDLKPNKWPDEFNKSWESRMILLKDNTIEKEEKIKELEDLQLFADSLKKILKLFENDGEMWSMKKIKSLMDILKKITDKTCEVNLETGISQKDWNKFLEVKNELDKTLIDHIRKKLLDDRVDCCFTGIKTSKDEEIVFKYPKLFYYLNGHFLEELIYSMFFDSSIQFHSSMLINRIVEENGLMNKCGYLVPNDLCEIFKRIDSLNFD